MSRFYVVIYIIISIISFNSKLTYAQVDERDVVDYAEDALFEDNETLDKKIKEVASSVCQLRASRSDSIYRIIDPRDDMDGKARFVDEIVDSEDDSFYCSAVVINDNSFITASHCNQANIERTIKFGKMELYGAKFVIDSKKKVSLIRNKECEKEAQLLKSKVGPQSQINIRSECRPIVVKVRYEHRLNDVYLTCFPGTKDEVRVKAPSTRGWPNPRFSASRGTYDTTVWRTSENISPKVARAPFLVEQKDVFYSIFKNSRSCKTLGYGPTDVGSRDAKPVFKILFTPVTSYNLESIASTSADYLRPGDSGGGFFCLGKDDKYYLVGINSRVYLIDQTSVFSLNSFNGDWIKYVLFDKSVPMDHEGSFYSGSPVIYHKTVVKHEIKNLGERLEFLNKCVKDIKRSGDKLGFGSEIKKEYKLLKNDYDKIVKTYKSGKEIDVVVRSLVFTHYDKVDKAIDECITISPESMIMGKKEIQDLMGEGFDFQ